jgi:arylsulfatase A-like enzyme
MSIKNVFIYVADSLRWDYLPETVANSGTTFKTVAQSNFSAPSFATLGSGLYPIQHQVHNWGDVLAPKTPTIFELDGINAGYRDHSEGTEATVFRILKQDEVTFLEDLEPPFVHLERNSHPHVPFGKDAPNTAEGYYRDRGNDWERMLRDYEYGIQQSVDRFQKRLDYLEEAGLLEETLVVFTSDHGELFGEYGAKGHGAPSCPELAYVPTVFINPQLDSEDFTVDPRTEIIEHVDMVQTALAGVGQRDALDIPGTDILSDERSKEWGYHHINIVRKGKQFYTAEAAWWHDGGHVFARNSLPYRMMYALSQFRDPPIRQNLLSEPTALLRTFAREKRTFGSPLDSKSRTENDIEEFRERLVQKEHRKQSLNDREKERLKDLGYLG